MSKVTRGYSRIFVTLLLIASMVFTSSAFAFADDVATETDAIADVTTGTDTNAPEYSSEWAKMDGVWTYWGQDGTVLLQIDKQKSTFITIEDKTFYISKKGTPLGQGFHYIQKKLYYMGADRAVIKSSTFTDLDGKEYTASKSGYIWGLKYYQYKYPKTTYVLVDLSEQKLYFSKSGKLKYTFNVVTGLPGKKTQTPTGTYKVLTKFRNAHLRGKVNGKSWDRHVSYWIAFIGCEYGFHDAKWRDDSDFDSDQTYLTNGSAGCVTLRLKDAKKLYYAVSYGTKVIICK